LAIFHEIYFLYGEYFNKKNLLVFYPKKIASFISWLHAVANGSRAEPAGRAQSLRGAPPWVTKQ
jgi:hypothetical protein